MTSKGERKLNTFEVTAVYMNGSSATGRNCLCPPELKHDDELVLSGLILALSFLVNSFARTL